VRWGSRPEACLTARLDAPLAILGTGKAPRPGRPKLRRPLAAVLGPRPGNTPSYQPYLLSPLHRL
jgi:hypothetical protein